MNKKTVILRVFSLFFFILFTLFWCDMFWKVQKKKKEWAIIIIHFFSSSNKIMIRDESFTLLKYIHLSFCIRKRKGVKGEGGFASLTLDIAWKLTELKRIPMHVGTWDLISHPCDYALIPSKIQSKIKKSLPIHKNAPLKGPALPRGWVLLYLDKAYKWWGSCQVLEKPALRFGGFLTTPHI